MPTYDYECTRCGHQFEKFQSITDPPLEVCPKCRGPLQRLIGPGAGLLFKGTGFHVTDYRSREYRRKAGADTGTPPAGTGTPSTGTGTSSADSAPARAGAKKSKPGSKTGPAG